MVRIKTDKTDTEDVMTNTVAKHGGNQSLLVVSR